MLRRILLLIVMLSCAGHAFSGGDSSTLSVEENSNYITIRKHDAVCSVTLRVWKDSTVNKGVWIWNQEPYSNDALCQNTVGEEIFEAVFLLQKELQNPDMVVFQIFNGVDDARYLIKSYLSKSKPTNTAESKAVVTDLMLSSASGLLKLFSLHGIKFDDLTVDDVRWVNRAYVENKMKIDLSYYDLTNTNIRYPYTGVVVGKVLAKSTNTSP